MNNNKYMITTITAVAAAGAFAFGVAYRNSKKNKTSNKVVFGVK